MKSKLYEPPSISGIACRDEAIILWPLLPSPCPSNVSEILTVGYRSIEVLRRPTEFYLGSFDEGAKLSCCF